jgi:hypothetical protein
MGLKNEGHVQKKEHEARKRGCIYFSKDVLIILGNNSQA